MNSAGGVSFGASTGITLNASANKARGNGDGEDAIQRNTHIVAGSTARICAELQLKHQVAITAHSPQRPEVT
jgi:hypothetical protein